MKTVILATALLFGTAAIAQTAPAGARPERPTSMPQNATMPPAPDSAPAAGEPSTTAQSSNSPSNAMPASMPAGTTLAAAESGKYPSCSRTVRDKCVNHGISRR